MALMVVGMRKAVGMKMAVGMETAVGMKTSVGMKTTVVARMAERALVVLMLAMAASGAEMERLAWLIVGCPMRRRVAEFRSAVVATQR